MTYRPKLAKDHAEHFIPGTPEVFTDWGYWSEDGLLWRCTHDGGYVEHTAEIGVVVTEGYIFHYISPPAATSSEHLWSGFRARHLCWYTRRYVQRRRMTSCAKPFWSVPMENKPSELYPYAFYWDDYKLRVRYDECKPHKDDHSVMAFIYQDVLYMDDTLYDSAERRVLDCAPHDIPVVNLSVVEKYWDALSAGYVTPQQLLTQAYLDKVKGGDDDA